MKKTLGPSDRLYPMPCPLVLGGTMEQADALAVAWIAIAGATPPTIVMALRRSRRTLELIRETREFTVNIPRARDAAVVDYFGIVSGRDHDKFAESGWTLEPASVIGTPLVAECPYNLECRVLSEVDNDGTHILVIGEVVESHADESILDAGGKVDIELLDPLVYIAGSREYRRLGEKVADAFSAGKSVKPE